MGSFAVDDDLDVVWSQAMERYEKITNVSLKSHNGFTAITGDITRTLDKSKAGNRAKAQAIMGNMMVCLQRFGGIIAQAASVAFGPSAQCWNAISFVVTAAQQYQKVLDGFTTLMERSVVFLERLNIFLGEKSKTGSYLDPRLRKDAYAILGHFLAVLANSYKLSKSKWQKTKTVLNIVLFNDDAGVSAALDQMETLVSNMTATSVAVIVKNLEGLSKYMTDSQEEILRHEAEILAHAERTEAIVERTEIVIQQMKGDQDRQLSQQKNEKNLEKIRKALQIKEESWRTEHNDKCRLRKGTGSWLTERNAPFRHWADVKENNITVMTMTSKEGFGKSYVTSRIISHLVDKVKPLSGGAHGRIVIAYYYFSKDASEEKVAKCLCSLIYQFAVADSDYAKAAANVCEQMEDLGRADEIWQHLVTDLESSMQGTYWIVIDGYNKSDGDPSADATIVSIARRAMSVNERPSFRLFVTGREEELGSIPFENHNKIPDIALGRPRQKLGLQRRPSRLNEEDWQLDDTLLEPLINEEDVIAFASSRIEDMCKENEDLAAILNDPELDAPTRLAKGVRGDYKNLQIKLNAISASDGDQQVKAIIDQAREDRAQSLKRIVQNMNSTLSSDELEELNWLLTWILGAYGSKSVDFLQAALVQSTGKKHWLRTHIETKFSAILALDGDDVSCSDGLREMLSTTEDATSDAPAWQRPNMDVQKSEIAIMRRVVKQFCGDELYDRMDFETFFNQRAGNNVRRIHLEDENTIHTLILSACLDSLCQGDQKGMEKGDNTVAKYAVWYLHEHMMAIDFLQSDRDAARDIGDRLASILYDPELIDTWWHPTNLQSLKFDIPWEKKTLDAFASTLKNPIVAAGLRNHPERDVWIKSAVSGDENGARLFARVAERLADRWFETLAAPDNFWCALSIVSRIWNEPFAIDEWPSVDLINRFVQWSEEHTSLKVSKAHRTWRKAAFLVVCEHNEEALAACKQAEEELPDHWGLILCEAKVYRSLKRYHEAVQCLHSYKALGDRLLDTDTEYSQYYYEQVIPLEGDTHNQLNDFTAAAACYELVLTHDFGDTPAATLVPFQAAVCLFKVWSAAKEYDSAINLLLKWRDDEGSAKGLHFWLRGLLVYVDFHTCIVSAVIRTGRHGVVRQIYDQMLDLDTDKNPSQASLWRFFRASLMFYASQSEADHLAALSQWRDLILLDTDEQNAEWLTEKSTTTLARALLDRAVETGVAPMTQVALECKAGLEEMLKIDAEVIRNALQANDDPRLTLARLHVLNGDQHSAREAVKTRMSEIFSAWPDITDAEALALRYDKLAHTLTVLDDDVNALAAWQLWEPKQPSSETKDNKDEEPSLGASKDDDKSHPQDGTQKPNEATEPTKKSVSEGESSTNGNSNGHIDSTDRHAFADIATDKLESLQAFTCDGCNKEWNIANDQWVCKHCLDTQLCSDCFTMLQNGNLPPLICSKDHKFLHLPTFDRAAWEKRPADMMIVGDELVPRQVWIDRLRAEWGLQQEVIDQRKMTLMQEVRAATVFTRLRKAVLKKRALQQT